MTYEEYWHGQPEQLKFYRQADKLKRKQQNFDLWLQGRYIYESIICASPAVNPFSKAKKCYPYPEHPFPLSKEEAEAQEEAERIRNYHKMLDKMKAEYRNQQLRKQKEGEENGGNS